MTIITILICIAIQKFANVGGWFSSSWFESYLKLLQPWLKKLNEWLGVLLVLVPIYLVLLGLHYILTWKMFGFGLFDLLLVVIVLFFAMDARDFKYELAQYFERLDKKDINGAASAVAEFLYGPAPTSLMELNRAVTQAIALRSFERLFAVLFWFALFGIYGAAIYYAITLIKKTALQVDTNLAALAKITARIQDILDWLPTRILGFSYTLAGKFARVFNYWGKHCLSGPASNQKFIVDTSLTAIDVNPAEEPIKSSAKENNEALDLINRVLIIWVIAVALFSLGRWL